MIQTVNLFWSISGFAPSAFARVHLFGVDSYFRVIQNGSQINEEFHKLHCLELKIDLMIDPFSQI
jgi:hypothetical protein